MVPPSQVLKGERDALLRLIQSMRKEYEAVQSAKGAQDDELRRLKERMLLGVSAGPDNGQSASGGAGRLLLDDALPPFLMSLHTVNFTQPLRLSPTY